MKGNSGILIILALIGVLAGRNRNLGPGFGLGLGITLIFMFSVSIVMAIIKKRRDGLTKVIFFGILMGILIVLLSYFEMKNLNEDILAPFIPLILMLLLTSIYKLVKKTGDEDAISKARLGMIISIPALSIMLIVTLYFSIGRLIR